MNQSTIIILILGFGLLFVMFAIYYMLSTFKGRKIKVQKRGKTNVLPDHIIAKYFPNFDRERFNDSVFKTFVEIQRAANDFDVNVMNDLMSEGLAKYYINALNKFRNNGRILIRSEFAHFYTDVIGVKRENGEIYVNVLMGVEYKEYFKDTLGTIIGDLEQSIKYREFNLVFICHNNIRAIISCPNCGALVSDKLGRICKYCEKPLVIYDYELVLVSERAKDIKKPKFFKGGI